MTIVFTVDDVIDVLAKAYNTTGQGVDRGTVGYLVDLFVEDLNPKEWTRAINRFEDLTR